MKIELTPDEVAKIIVQHLAPKNFNLYENGKFDVQWIINTATTQGPFLSGVAVILEAKP